MRKGTIILAVLALVQLAVAAHAGVFTFQPTPRDLNDLDHGVYYTWGVNWTIPVGEEITAANIFIDNINDWTVENNDILYIHLLDNPALGVKSYNDNAGNGDAFAGQGILLTTYTDNGRGSNPAEDFSYNLTTAQIATLTTYADNSRFGLGMDPDCHYYNDGITLSITTAVTPEPATLVLLAIGSATLLHRRRTAA